MYIHFVTRSERNWLQTLANILDSAQENDVVVVFSDDAAELARNALKRRPDGKYLRVMTQETYETLEKQP